MQDAAHGSLVTTGRGRMWVRASRWQIPELRISLSDWAVVFEMNKVETVCTGVSVFYNCSVCN